MGGENKALAKIPGSIQEAAAVKKDSGRRSTSEMMLKKAEDKKSMTEKPAKGEIEKTSFKETTTTTNNGANVSDGLQKPKKVVKGRDSYSELKEDAKKAPRLSAEKLAGFNRYPKWLAKKGIKPGDDFDTGGKGNQLFEQFLSENKEYFKAHPERAISKSDIPSIRRELAHNRERDVDEIISGVTASGGTAQFKNRQGQMVSGEEGDYTDFRPWVNRNEKTKDPNYMGKNMSSIRFRETPKSKLPPITKEERDKDEWAVYDDDGNYRGVQGETINTVLPGKTETIQLPQSAPKKSVGGSLTFTNYNK